jgi:hypothetical protein
MAKIFNQDRAAKALADAILMGDRAAAEKYGVSCKSLELWRTRLETDADFRAHFQAARQAKDEAWSSDLPAALTSCINFLKEAGQQASRSDPDAIAAISNALATLADIALTQKIVDVRLQALRGEGGKEGETKSPPTG